MLHLKHASAHLDVVGSTGADLDISGSYVSYVDAATTSTPKKIDNVKPTTAVTTQILTGVDSSTTLGVKEFSVANIDASLSTVITINLHDGALSCRKWQGTLYPGDVLYYEHGKGFYTVVAATYYATYVLAADQSNSTATPTSLTGLKAASLPAGTYEFDYYILYQNGAATTGIKFDINFTGTVTHIVWNQMYVDTSATAATAVPDQDAVGAAAQVYSAFASRAKGTAGRGVTLSVDTAGGDMLMRIEGLMVVTVAGDLEIWHGSETTAISTVQAGSCLILTKVA